MKKTGKCLLILGSLFFLAIFAAADQIYALKAGRLIDGQNAGAPVTSSSLSKGIR